MDDLVTEVNKRIVKVKLENIGLKYVKACKICQEEFPLVEFSVHTQTHLNSQKYSSSVPVESPVAVIIGDSLSFLCTICEEIYSKETQLRIHQVQKHSSSLVVRLADSELPSPVKQPINDLTENLKKSVLKRYKCCYCEKHFFLLSQCKSHENAHAENNLIIKKSLEETSIENQDHPNHIELFSSTESHLLGDKTELHCTNFQDQSELEFISIETIIQSPIKSSEDKKNGKNNNYSAEMESNGKNNEISYPMEMPKLIAPTKVEPIQLTHLSDFTNNFQRVHETVSFVTNMDIPALTPVVKSEPEISYTGAVVKQEVQESSNFSRILNNGEIFGRECDEKSHKCLTCGDIFPESQIFPHIKTHLVKGQKSCSLCPYRAIASGDLRDHMNKHYSIKPYKCPICPNAYGWQSGWKKHLATHDKDQKLFKCTHCKLRFDTQRERRRHELIHQNITGPSPKKKSKKSGNISQNQNPVQPGYIANGNPVQTYPSAQTHQFHQYNPEQQQHNYSAPVPYPTSQNYSTQSRQTYFNNTNYENPNYDRQETSLENSWNSAQSGEYSNYSYSNQIQPPPPPNHWDQTQQEETTVERVSSSGNEVDDEQNLMIDADEQKNEKTFREPDDLRVSERCKTCGEEIQMADLPSHIQNHILPGQKSCTICKYKCSTKLYLAEHYNIHYGLKPYACTVCKRKFAMRSYLRSHTQQVHENESTRRYQCRYCNKRFVRPCHQRTHEKIHEGQGEVLPPGESSTVDPNLDSDCPKIGTPERCSTTSSPSTTPYTRSHTNSPALAPNTNNSSQKTENQWGQGQSSSNQPSPWSYWSGNQYSSEFTPPYDPATWSHGSSSYYHSPIVKSDVNWTEPLSDSSSWQNPTTQGTYGQQVKTSEVGWGGDSSSSGFQSVSTTNSSCPSVPPSASVQDLWAELHYEEMKWFPETSTVYTADGIPMVTELAPLDACFSYTDMLNSAVADLPLFSSMATVPPPPSQDVTVQIKEEPLEESETVKKRTIKTKSPGGWKGQGPRPARNLKGRGKGRLTAEAKHKMKMSFVQGEETTVPEAEVDLDFEFESLSSSPKGMESSGDDETDMDSLVMCQTCRIDIVKRDLLVHIRGHLLPGQRTCDLCQRTYCNPLTLREHIHVHYNLKPHKCSYCQERFSTKYSLKTHEVFTHEQDKGSILECPYPGCGKPFAMKYEFHKHVKTHETKNGTSQCHVENVKEWRSIEEIELEEKEIKARIKDAKSRTWKVTLVDVGRRMKKKCPICDEEIVLAEFYEHKYSHKEPCHICAMPIFCTEVLYHGPTHIGASMECEVCGWKAQQRSQLWEHMNGHMKVKPIRCLYCGNGFASRNSLRSHYLALHTNFRPHHCRYCDKTFVQGNTVKQHELTHFGTQCPACPESFPLRKDLKFHLREVHKFDY